MSCFTLWFTKGTQACSIPLSYHLEVKWTKYGTLVNPQAQIVSVMETIITNTSSLVSLHPRTFKVDRLNCNTSLSNLCNWQPI